MQNRSGPFFAKKALTFRPVEGVCFQQRLLKIFKPSVRTIDSGGPLF